MNPFRHTAFALCFGLLLGAATPPTAYFGQTPPGAKAVVFAPGFICTKDTFAMNGAFSPDGREFYYTVTNGAWDTFQIWRTRLQEGTWTEPAPVRFFADKETFEPCFAPDGRRLFFTAGTVANTDIHFVEKGSEGWGQPVRLPDVISSSAHEMFASVSTLGAIYFGRSGDIWCSRLEGGQYRKAEPLGPPVNSDKHNVGDPLISPQEDFLIHTQAEGPGGLGQMDLYIRYRTKQGTWTEPFNLGPEINSPEFECGPSLTPDGKYLLFTRREKWRTGNPSKIYWISADFIRQLRPLRHR